MQQIKLDFSLEGQGSISWVELGGWADAKNQFSSEYGLIV